MSLRHLFRSSPPADPAPEDELAPRPPGVDPAAESETVRRIGGQLEALPIEQRRFVAGFAYVLGRVANADLTFSDAEVGLIEHSVTDIAGLTEAQAVLVVQIARNQEELFGATEDYIVTREFAATASREQCEQLLRAGFTLSATDAGISSVESAELNEIGKELGFTDAEVDAMRMEYHDQLTAVRAVRDAAAAST